MTDIGRRKFLQQAASVGGAALMPTALHAADDGKLDMLIRGGDVIDPSQALTGRYDIGIRWGKIVKVAPSIPESTARQILDASGNIVTPGLIDLHTHVYPLGSALGLPPDELTPYTATVFL